MADEHTRSDVMINKVLKHLLPKLNRFNYFILFALLDPATRRRYACLASTLVSSVGSHLCLIKKHNTSKSTEM